MSEAATRVGNEPTVRALTLIVGSRRHDVVVDENLPVAEAFALVEPGATVRICTLSGRELLPTQTVAQARLGAGAVLLGHYPSGGLTAGPSPALGAAQVARSVPTGRPGSGAASVPRPVVSTATLTSLTPAGSGSRAELAAGATAWTPLAPPTPLRAAGGHPTTPRLYAVLGGTLLTASLAVLAVVAGVGAGQDTSARWPVVLAGGMLLAGLGLAQLRGANAAARHIAPVLGLAGGALGAAQLAGTGPVLLLGACGGAALVALAGPVEPGSTRHLPGVWAATAAVVAGLGLWALVVGAPAAAVAALVLAVATVLPRVLPMLVIDVDAPLLIDFARLSVTSWSPRERRARQRERWQIDVPGVRRLVAQSAATQTAVLVAIAVASIASSIMLGWAGSSSVRAPGATVPAPPGAWAGASSWLDGWALAILLASACVAPLVGARAFRRWRDRLIVRIGALAPGLLLVLSAAAAAPVLDAVIAVVLAIGVALVLAVRSRPGRSRPGSLTGARLAEALEGLALVAVIPAALWVSGAVTWFRGLHG